MRDSDGFCRDRASLCFFVRRRARAGASTVSSTTKGLSVGAGRGSERWRDSACAARGPRGEGPGVAGAGRRDRGVPGLSSESYLASGPEWHRLRLVTSRGPPYPSRSRVAQGPRLVTSSDASVLQPASSVQQHRRSFARPLCFCTGQLRPSDRRRDPAIAPRGETDGSQQPCPPSLCQSAA